MKILVNGCSFSRGPISWPYYLQELLNCELVNLAQSGAGNSYIHESTVSELVHREYDLVIIMWSGLSRLDFKVEQVAQFSKTPFTSDYQHRQNDWPGKVIIPVNDQDYVEKDWVFGCGILNNEQELVRSNFLNGLYRYIGVEQFTYHFLNISKVYNTFFVDVVCETFSEGRTFFPTEKIWRPIICKTPFIVQGPVNYLHNLKQLGFKTFNDWWDESYDEDGGLTAIETIKRNINMLSTRDVAHMYTEMQDILEHNFQRLTELTSRDFTRIYGN